MKSTANTFGEELISTAESNKDFTVCVPDTRSCGLENFEKQYPGRGFNLGIAEQNLLDVAAGIASCGKKVYVATFAVFMSMRACEQIRQFICYPNQNVTLLSTHTGLQVGLDGGSHIAVEDVGIMRSLPNMTVVQPADEIAARAMVRFSLNYRYPLYIRLQREANIQVYDDSYKFEFNKPCMIRNYGDDVTIFSSGVMTGRLLKTSEILKWKNINVKLVDVATIKPINEDVVSEFARNSKVVVTVEDHNIIGGLGSAIAEALAKTEPKKIKFIGIPDVYGESGTSEQLYDMYGLTSEKMADSIENYYKMEVC